MSTIRFTFEDLCAFFTSNPSRLMVGLISTEGEAPENVHEPHIVIKQNGIFRREYQGFAEVNGDIGLLVYPDDQPLTRHITRSARDPTSELQQSRKILRRISIHKRNCTLMHARAGHGYISGMESSTLCGASLT